MLVDAHAAIGWALVSVFAIAGVGKLISRPKPPEATLAASEVGLAVMIVSARLAIPIALLTAGIALGYAIYPFTSLSPERCHCFGERLPSTGRSVQRARNLLLAALAFSYAALTFLERGNATSPSLDAVIGLALGASLVATPWLLEWLSGTDLRADLR